MLVEYTLILAVFVLVSVGAVGVMNDNADDYFENSSDHIGSPVNRFSFDDDGNRPGANTLASTTTVTAPPTTSTTTTTTTTAPPATTTIAPTTTVGSTTTVSGPTTTIAATTTTQAASLSTTLTDLSADIPNSNRWDAVIRVQVTGTQGVNVGGVSISATFTRSNGNTNTRSCITDGSGVCELRRDESGRRLEWWDVELNTVNGSVPWTGTQATIRANKP